MRQQGCCGALKRGALRAMRLRSTHWATPSMGYGAWYGRGTWLLWVWRSTAERPSPLLQRPQRQCAEWECAELALRAHQSIFTVRAPFVTQRVRVRLIWVGSVGSAPSRAACRGLACRGHRAGAVRQQGCCGTLGGDRGARDVTTEYSRRTPPMGTVRGYRRGSSLLWVRRSTAERPSPLRVCSDLRNNTLNGSVPSSLSALTNLRSLCVASSCQRRLRVRLMLARIGRLCSEQRGMSGDA